MSKPSRFKEYVEARKGRKEGRRDHLQSIHTYAVAQTPSSVNLNMWVGLRFVVVVVVEGVTD